MNEYAFKRPILESNITYKENQSEILRLKYILYIFENGYSVRTL